jgi:hypothetical protein
MSAVELVEIEQLVPSTIPKPMGSLSVTFAPRTISNDDGVDAIFDGINDSATLTDINALAYNTNQQLRGLEGFNNAQNEAIAEQTNQSLAQVSNNFVLVNDKLASIVGDINSLNDTFSTDEEREQLKATLDLVKQQLEETDTDVIATINANVGVLAQRDVTWQRECSVGTSNGRYEFVFSDEIGKVFDSESEVVVSVQVKGNPKATAYVVSKSATSAVVQVMSNGTHLIPTTKDCALESVELIFTVTHKQKDMLQAIAVAE